MRNESRSQSGNHNSKDGMNEQVIDLRVLINILKKHFWFIALIALIAVTASGLLSYLMMKPVYVAKTVLLVTQAAEKPQVSGQKDDIDSILNSISRIPILTMNTYVGRIKSDILMQRVIDKLQLEQLGYTPRALAGQIQVNAAQDSYLIEVYVSNSNPRLAAEIANTLSQEYMALITENYTEVMDRSVKFLREQMEQTKLELAAATDPTERQRLQGVLTLLAEGITRTQIARSIDLGSTSLVIVSPAIIPSSPVGSNRERNIAVAFLLGLTVSIALVLIREFLDNKVKTPDDVVQHLDLPILGVIAHADRRSLN